MKVGDRVKIINPNSSFCGEEATVVAIEGSRLVDILIDRTEVPCEFRIHELELISVSR